MNIAIIVAGGNGTRMKLSENKSKQFLSLGGMPVLVRTIKAFACIDKIDRIVVVTRKSDTETVEGLIKTHSIKNICSVTEGGNTRQKSVYNGITYAISSYKNIKNILIHDGARPFVTKKCILDVLSMLNTVKAAASGVYVKDTIKLIDDDGFIDSTPPRDRLVSIQTPQGFDARLIKKAHDLAKNSDKVYTDDCALIEELTNEKVYLVVGDYNNIKITTPEDITLGENILKSML